MHILASASEVTADEVLGMIDYAYFLWMIVISVFGLNYLTKGMGLVGHDRVTPKGNFSHVLLAPFSLAVFFSCTSLVGGFLIGFYQHFFGPSEAFVYFAQFVGQCLAIVVMLVIGLTSAGSVQWSASAKLEGPVEVEPTSPFEDLIASWKSLNLKTIVTAFLSLCALAIIAGLIWKVFYYFCELNGQILPEELQPLVEIIAQYDWNGSLWPIIFLAAACIIGAPIIEEIVFRGTFYPALKRVLPRGYAIIFTGLIFGIIHGSLSAVLPLTAFGCLLCVFRDRFGLATCICLHAAFNFHTFFWLIVAPKGATQF